MTEILERHRWARRKFTDQAAVFCLKHNLRTINCTPRAEELTGLLEAAYRAGAASSTEHRAPIDWPKCDYTGKPCLDAEQLCRCGTCQLFATKLQGIYEARRGWTCRAAPFKNGTPGGGDPVDCDYPFCGCDPAAEQVMTALEEAGVCLKRHGWEPEEAEHRAGWELAREAAAEICDAGFDVCNARPPLDAQLIRALVYPGAAPKPSEQTCPTCGTDLRCIHGLLFSERCEPCEAPEPEENADRRDAAGEGKHE